MVTRGSGRETGELLYKGLRRFGHDGATNTFTFYTISDIQDEKVLEICFITL